MATEPLVVVEIHPRSPKIAHILREKGRPMFLYRRQVPARIAALIQLGTPKQQRDGHAMAREWLRENLSKFDSMDQSYLL